MFKRIKRLWTLANKDPRVLEVFESLTPEQIAIIPEAGDEKAEFIGEGTHEEFEEQERADKGLDKWYNRIKNL